MRGSKEGRDREVERQLNYIADAFWLKKRQEDLAAQIENERKRAKFINALGGDQWLTR